MTTRGPHLLGALVVLAVGLHLVAAYEPGAFGVTLFTDRDLARALRWREELPLAGAEMTGGTGTRLPGPALGLAYGLGAWIAPDPTGPFALVLFGAVAAGLVLYRAVARTVDAWTGVVLAGLVLTSPVALSALSELWNPSFVPLPWAVAVAGALGVLRGHPSGMVIAAAGAAIATQLHASATVWALAALPALAALRARTVLRGLAPAAGVVLLTYLPWLVGGGTVGDLLGQAGGSWLPEHAPGLSAVGEGLVRLLQAPLDHPSGPGQGGPWGPAAALAALGLAGALRAGGSRRAVALVAASQLLLGLALLGLGSRVDLPDRYLLPGVPAALGLVALGLVFLRELAGGLGRPAHTLAAVGLVLALSPRLAAHRVLWAGSSSMSHASVATALDAVEARMGWSDADAVARTAWVPFPQPGRAGPWEHFPAVDHRLARVGQHFGGSGAPPCALLLRDAPANLLPDAAFVTRTLGARARAREVGPAEPLPGGWTLVRYTSGTGLCPTTMSQRYVPLPEERVARAWSERLGPGEATTLPLDGGVRFVAHLADCTLPLDRCGATYVVVDLVAGADGVEARLVSNQLRGIADNDGWFQATALARPALVLEHEGTGEIREIVLHEDVVGRRYALTPIRARSEALAPGGWRVRLVARWFEEDWEEPSRVRVDAPLDVVLGTLRTGGP